MGVGWRREQECGSEREFLSSVLPQMATKARTLLGRIQKLATPIGSPKHFSGIQISRSSSAVSQVDWQKLDQKYQEAGSGPRNIHVGFGFSSWALIFWVTICTLHPQSFFFLNKCFNCPNNALSHLYFIFFIRLVFENRIRLHGLFQEKNGTIEANLPSLLNLFSGPILSSFVNACLLA